MTCYISKYEQSFTDCAGELIFTAPVPLHTNFNSLYSTALTGSHLSSTLHRCIVVLYLMSHTENCLLRFIQLALLDSGGDGRVISGFRAGELGADVKISECVSIFSSLVLHLSRYFLQVLQSMALCLFPNGIRERSVRDFSIISIISISFYAVMTRAASGRSSRALAPLPAHMSVEADSKCRLGPPTFWRSCRACSRV
jgi:hypothetical protein